MVAASQVKHKAFCLNYTLFFHKITGHGFDFSLSEGWHRSALQHCYCHTTYPSCTPLWTSLLLHITQHRAPLICSEQRYPGSAALAEGCHQQRGPYPTKAKASEGTSRYNMCAKQRAPSSQELLLNSARQGPSLQFLTINGNNTSLVCHQKVFSGHFDLLQKHPWLL